MGYSKCGARGHLCCDACDSCRCDGKPTRTYRCPFGYCQRDILCADCKARYAAKLGIAGHRERGCEASSARYKAERAREASLLAEGKAVRVSALTMHGEENLFGDLGTVHVLFRRADGSTAGRYMTAGTYREVSGVATVEDYEFAARIVGVARPVDAPSEFAFGGVSKEA